MLNKSLINIALWLLRRSIAKQWGTPKSKSPNTVGDGTHPCQLLRDAGAEKTLQIAVAVTALEQLVIENFELQGEIMECEMNNPG